jgi:hypothetical protein
VIDSTWLVVKPRGRDRIAAVQVWFAGGDRCREYLIFHRPPRSNGKARQPGRWWVFSFKHFAGPKFLDLRRPEDAALLEGAVVPVTLEAVEADLKAREVVATLEEVSGRPLESKEERDYFTRTGVIE